MNISYLSDLIQLVPYLHTGVVGARDNFTQQSKEDDSQGQYNYAVIQNPLCIV